MTRRTVRRAFIAAPVALALSALLSAATAAEPEPAKFRVIVHPGNKITSAPRVFVERAFLKNVHEWSDGNALRPVDLAANSPVRKEFSSEVLKRSVEAVKSYWQQRIFSGRGVPPPELATESAVVEYVQKHPGAVGYVGPNTDVQRARVIALR